MNQQQNEQEFANEMHKNVAEGKDYSVAAIVIPSHLIKPMCDQMRYAVAHGARSVSILCDASDPELKITYEGKIPIPRDLYIGEMFIMGHTAPMEGVVNTLIDIWDEAAEVYNATQSTSNNSGTTEQGSSEVYSGEIVGQSDDSGDSNSSIDS